MTEQQHKVISDFFALHKQNCDDYATSEYCQFSTYRNEKNEQDNNIVVITTIISGYDNNLIPETETKNFLIEPDGSFYEMDMMPDVFRDYNEIITYLQNLTNFNWNEK